MPLVLLSVKTDLKQQMISGVITKIIFAPDIQTRLVYVFTKRNIT